MATEGRWDVTEAHGCIQVVAHQTDGRFVGIADVFTEIEWSNDGVEHHPGEPEANAYLIAAAPLMRDALDRIEREIHAAKSAGLHTMLLPEQAWRNIRLALETSRPPNEEEDDDRP